MLAWVNGQANGGHGKAPFLLVYGVSHKAKRRTDYACVLRPGSVGIGGPGHFLDESWQTALRDKTPEGEATRKNVLGRMRLPETPDGKYNLGRQGQGFPYFMPWFSGDNGLSRHFSFLRSRFPCNS